MAVGVATIAINFVCLAPGVAQASPHDTCGGRSAAGLDQMFQGQVGRVAGSDYLRSFVLPNGNTLVLMQDVFLAETQSGKPLASLRQAGFAHNAAVLFDSQRCVIRTISGTRSYIGGSRTTPLTRWFWAMGGAIGADGLLHVLVAEMRNPNGTGAAMGAEPVATWHATIDPSTLDVQSFSPAANPGTGLYGWAVASDETYTYLYSYCYRQFIEDEYLGHDASCVGDVRVGRVPRGQFDAPLEYYGDGGWHADESAAGPLDFSGERRINPVSIQRFGHTFVSVSKEGDWWGTTIYVDIARSPVGPWKTLAKVRPTTKCADCNTYFASLMPWRQDNGSLVVALSNNAWDMRGVAFDNPWIYRNSFLEIMLPRGWRSL